MRNHIAFLLLLLCTSMTAQKYATDRMGFCGTESIDRFVEELKTHSKAMARFDRKEQRAPITDYPVTVHILRKSDGTGGINVDSFLTELDRVNDFISPSGVALKICSEINFVDSDQYYDFYKPDENNLYYSTRVPNTMNLYISNSLTYASGAVRCGYAFFPGWKDMILIDRHCVVDGSTFAHEVGHYFGLFHTHGNEISDTEELNDQSNCMITGDDVCDTPADPLLTYTVDSATCMYTGNDIDANGDPYSPDPSNIMSYAPKHCKLTLGEGQYNRMAYVAAFLRDYMTCQPFSAEFSIDRTVGICGQEHLVNATYTGTAEDVDLLWDVDSDGVADADTAFTAFTFSTPGRHDICLTVSAEGDSVRRCKSFSVLGTASGPHVINVDNSADCALINDDNDHGWQVLDLDSNTTDVLMMDNFHYNTTGAEDVILICPLDLTGMETPALTFELAYIPHGPQRSDALRIEVSTDCGLTFEELFFGAGLDISSTGEYLGDQWQPYSQEDWQDHTFELTEYTGESIVLRFTNITGHGNYMYIQNIAVADIEPLPLTFLSLDVNRTAEGKHDIVWSTADESGVLLFAVERSEDGKRFETIGQRDAVNGHLNKYTLLANDIGQSVYYRVRVQFEDGEVEYSPIVFLRQKPREQISVFPNPGTDRIQINGPEINETQSYTIHDATGKMVVDQVAIKGSVDISTLVPGVYTLRLAQQTTRFVKVAN